VNEQILIRKLPASQRPLARRCRTWAIRMMKRKRGPALYLGQRPPGPSREGWTAHQVCSSAATVGVVCGLRALPNMSRTTWREHVRRCAKHGIVLPKSRYEAEVAANALRKGMK
jgi:hypothetical protein